MNRLFSATGRESIKEYIVALAQKSDDIIAVVQVGSGAAGYIDALSDLDFYVVVNREQNIAKAMDDLSAGIRKRLQILYFSQMPQRSLQVFLADNYLEIDIGYVSACGVNAKKASWKVLFDKSGSVGAAMKRSWKEHSKKDEKLNEIYAAYANDAWHFFFQAAIAAKRGRYWRCIGEMDIVRNWLIELKGLRHSLATKRYKGVDDFPPEELAVLKNTIPMNFTQETMFTCLNSLADVFYDEIELACNPENITVKRHHVKEYIKHASS